MYMMGVLLCVLFVVLSCTGPQPAASNLTHKNLMHYILNTFHSKYIYNDILPSNNLLK